MIPSNLMEGGVIRPVGKVTVEEGETRPPKPFTMEHAAGRDGYEPVRGGQNLKAALDDDESHSGGIGTPATRADTIESSCAQTRERKGRQLHATTEGERLTDVVEPRLNVLLTARMEQALSTWNTANGTADVDMFHREACEIPPTRPRTGPMPSHEPRTPTRRNGATAALRPAGEENRPDVAVFTNKTEKTKDGKWATTAGCGWKMFARIAARPSPTRPRRLGQSVTLKGFTSIRESSTRPSASTRNAARRSISTADQTPTISARRAMPRRALANDRDETMRRYSHAPSGPHGRAAHLLAPSLRQDGHAKSVS